MVRPERVSLRSYTENKLDNLGTSWLECTKSNLKHNIKFFVIKIEAQAILGLETSIKLKTKHIDIISANTCTPIQIL